MISSFIIHSIEIEIMKIILFGFIAKGLSGFYLASQKIDFKIFYKSLILMAWLNLIILSVSIQLFDLDAFVGYMRVGYALVPSSVVLLSIIMTRKFSLMSLFGFLYSIILLILYGNRGVFLVMIVFVVFTLLFVYQKNLKSFALISSLIIFTYLIMSMNLLSKIVFYLYEDLNIYSYTLMKFSKTFEEGLINASSGREDLYIEGINWFLENPVMGNGIGFSFQYSTTSVHNFLLQILIESGIIGFIIASTIFIIILYYIKKIEKKEKLIVIGLFFSLSFGRLLVSSDIWLRTELWIFLGLLVALINNRLHRTSSMHKKWRMK